MPEKKLDVRIIHKHDTENNWNKAVNFIPKKAELIVYDADDNYNYIRVKMGDGVTNVSELPFLDDEIYNELDQKQDLLVFDSTPTIDSNNPVTSNGIYTSLQNKIKNTQNIVTSSTIDTITQTATNNDVYKYVGEHYKYTTESDPIENITSSIYDASNRYVKLNYILQQDEKDVDIKAYIYTNSAHSSGGYANLSIVEYLNDGIVVYIANSTTYSRLNNYGLRDIIVSKSLYIDNGDMLIYYDNEWHKFSSNINIDNYYNKTETSSLIDNKISTASANDVVYHGYSSANSFSMYMYTNYNHIPLFLISGDYNYSYQYTYTTALWQIADRTTYIDIAGQIAYYASVGDVITLHVSGGISYTLNIIGKSEIGSSIYCEYNVDAARLAYNAVTSYTVRYNVKLKDGELVYIIKDFNNNNIVRKSTTIDLSGYQETLTFDSSPTIGSTNPVTSSGIKDYVDNKISGVYKIKGGITNTNLSINWETGNNVNFGDVYNIIGSNPYIYDYSITYNTIMPKSYFTYVSTISISCEYSVNFLLWGGTSSKSVIIHLNDDTKITSTAHYLGDNSIYIQNLSLSDFENSVSFEFVMPIELTTGDNIVWIEPGVWDKLSATVDLSNYQTKLTFDAIPTANSTNPVTSGGIKTVLDAKANQSDVYTKIETDSRIDNKLSNVYKIKGSILCDDIDTLTPDIGDVYNIIDDGSYEEDVSFIDSFVRFTQSNYTYGNLTFTDDVNVDNFDGCKCQLVLNSKTYNGALNIIVDLYQVKWLRFTADENITGYSAQSLVDIIITTRTPLLAGDNIAWTEEGWDKLAATVDLSNYSTTDETIELIEENASKYWGQIASYSYGQQLTLSNLTNAKHGDTAYFMSGVSSASKLARGTEIVLNKDEIGYYVTNVSYNNKFNNIIKSSQGGYFSLIQLLDANDSQIAYYSSNSSMINNGKYYLYDYSTRDYVQNIDNVDNAIKINLGIIHKQGLHIYDGDIWYYLGNEDLKIAKDVEENNENIVTSKAVYNYGETLKNYIDELKYKSIPHTVVSGYPVELKNSILYGENLLSCKIYGSENGVGDLQQDNTYKIDVCIKGENLYDEDIYLDTDNWSAYNSQITYPAGTYTISYDYIRAVTATMHIEIKYSDNIVGQRIFQQSMSEGNHSVTFTTTGEWYMYVYYNGVPSYNQIVTLFTTCLNNVVLERDDIKRTISVYNDTQLFRNDYIEVDNVPVINSKLNIIYTNTTNKPEKIEVEYYQDINKITGNLNILNEVLV